MTTPSVRIHPGRRTHAASVCGVVGCKKSGRPYRAEIKIELSPAASEKRSVRRARRVQRLCAQHGVELTGTISRRQIGLIWSPDGLI